MKTAAGMLLRSIVDYAGTFPPATLGLADAIAHYARARTGPHAWMLGRFVLPASQLEDFCRLIPPASGQSPWPLSLIVTPGARGIEAAKLGTTDSGVGIWEDISTFNERWQGRAVIASLEFAPLAVSEVARVSREIPKGIETYFELPPGGDLDERVAAIAKYGAGAKIRTGGIVPTAFPADADVIRFMRACATARIPFKATAGLHHALRGFYALTYEADSARATMHGFLNISVAAALIHSGAPSDLPLEALRESSVASFRFEEDHLTFRGQTVEAADLATARRELFRSFGSCAFEEPVGELERAGTI